MAIAVQRQEANKVNQMSELLTYLQSCLRRGAFAALAISVLPLIPAHSQDFGEHSQKPQFPVENHPRVSEKDYKAALQRIPTPNQKYDPWGVTHSDEPQKTSGVQKNTKNAN
jgi:hypothetical protein